MSRSVWKQDGRTAERRADERDHLVGVYSRRCVALGYPTSIWAGADGHEHEVIGVYRSIAEARLREPWDDLEIVGRMLRFVRPGRPALCDVPARRDQRLE